MTAVLDVEAARAGRSDIQGCTRCGGDHEGLDWTPFARPIIRGLSTFTHWATCPGTGDPIMLVVGGFQSEPTEPTPIRRRRRS